MRRKIAAGNWKMNGLPGSAAEIEALAKAHPDPGCDVIICPPFPLIPAFAALGAPFAIGAQDCHAAEKGAHTGDVSAQLIAAMGAKAVIVGHSERRTDHGETSDLVHDKAVAAQGAGLTAIVCVGETLAEREAGQTLDIVNDQLRGSVPAASTAENLVLAYEPVWAIGSGLVPTNDQIAEVHAALRAELAAHLDPARAEAIRILYGGSVKGSNAGEIFAIANVDGGLVGGASLTAEDFAPIVAAAG